VRIEPGQVEAVCALLRQWGVEISDKDIENAVGEFDTGSGDPAKNHLPGFRRTDPTTSRKAALDVYPRTGNQRGRALVAIIKSPSGATYAEVQAETSVNGIWKRISELKQNGWIEARGRRVVPETGSEADVYFPTERAIRWAYAEGIL